MGMTTEWGAFRKIERGFDQPERPMEGRTFLTLESAQAYIGHFRDGDSWLEVKSRHVTEWTK